MNILKSINLLCSIMNPYGVFKEYTIFLPQAMFKTVVHEIREKAVELTGKDFDADEIGQQDKFAYQDPQGFLYWFRSGGAVDTMVITMK